MLPKNIYTIVTKQAGQIIPADYLDIIVKKKPNVFGWAVQDGEGLSIGREEGTPEMADLETMNTETQGLRSMLCFGWLDQGFNVEDIQPFTINDGDDNPFIAFGMDGDFPKYDTNNGRTQEFNLMAEIIAPSMEDICELTDGDIAKLMATLGKPMFNNNFLAAVGHRGVLNILPFEGDPAYFGKDTLGGEPFTWGRTSNLHGWGEEKVQEPKVEEVKKPRFKFGGSKTVAAAPQNVATKGEGPKTSVPEVKKTGATTVVAVKPEVKKHEGPAPVRPPDWCHKNDDKRSWYQAVAGTIPSGWKKNIPVIPTEGATIPATVEQLNEWRASRAKATISAAAEQKPAATATAAPVKTAAEVSAARKEENLPIIPAKEMEKVLDFVAKHLDSQSVQISDPSTMQEAETKITKFSESVGCKSHQAVNWPMGGLLAMGKTDVRALWLYALEMRAYARMYMTEHKMFDAPVVTTTETKLGDNTKKVESVSNEKPKAKFQFRKAS